jgi:hypothetical protein
MTDYNDVPAVNALYLEQQQVQAAIAFLANGGTISSMMIAPPPPDPSTPLFEMAVSIVLPAPNPASLVDSAMTALLAREDAIYQELADLGVTNPPARRGTRPPN